MMKNEPIRALIADDEPPARRRIRTLLQAVPDVELVGECRNGREAVAAIRSARPDLVFLDIEMPELNGFEVLDLVGRDAVPAVVFVTAYDEHALRAFAAEAQDYLLKPFERDRFLAAIDRARTQVVGRRARANGGGNGGENGGGAAHPGSNGSATGSAATAVPAASHEGESHIQRIPVRVAGRIRIVEVDSVDYFEAQGNYVRVHVGPSSFLIRESLAKLEARLDPKYFLRIHRGTIVRLDRIEELEALFQGEYRVRLRGGAEVRSSRRYRLQLNTALDIQ